MDITLTITTGNNSREIHATLPESWEDITYSDYLKVMEVADDQELSSMEKAAHFLSVLTGIDLEILEQAGIDSVNQLYPHLKFLQTPIPSPEEAEPVAFVTVQGVNYYPQKLETFGELMYYDRIETQFQEKPRERWPYILGILLRPGVQVPLNEAKTPWYRSVLGRKSKEITPIPQVKPFELDDELVLKRGKLFASTLNPVQITGLAAFFLRKDERLNVFFQPYLSLPAWVTTRIGNLGVAFGEYMAGNPRLTIWNRMFFTSIKFLTFLLRKF